MSDKELLLLLRKHPEQGIHKMMALYGGAIATICRNFLYDCSEEDVEEAIDNAMLNASMLHPEHFAYTEKRFKEEHNIIQLEPERVFPLNVDAETVVAAVEAMFPEVE